MKQVLLRSLDLISTSYPVFEKDQVLTEKQLNDLTSYFEDQTRLTRVSLLGAGIACGLRVSLQRDGKVRVTKGTGVTTDGDLLRLASDTVFDRFKPYDEAAPEYAPFYIGESESERKRMTIFELVPEGATDLRAAALGGFDNGQRMLTNCVAVLLMESYEKDSDLCSSTDCDNLGKESINQTKLLLIDKGSAAQLKESIVTPDSAARKLGEIVAYRPEMASADTLEKLYAGHRKACNAIHTQVCERLKILYASCSGFVADLFTDDPTSLWILRLTEIQKKFSVTNWAIQYYYDFLKDVVDTYHAFRDLLFDEVTVCCPDTNAFPKHLLLGHVVSEGGDENRTGFYPSAVTSSTNEALRHARFLLKKLHQLILDFRFDLGLESLQIRITPSLFEDRSLEERAIPYYYGGSGPYTMHRCWSYALERRNMATSNYSYDADKYDADGAAASPLTAQIGRFPFFRIEGHLRANVETAKKALEDEIRRYSLPITVRALMIGTDKTKIIKPRPRYTDLHQIRDLLRQDVAYQLDDVAEFSERFKTKMHAAVDAKTIGDAPEGNEGMSMKDVVSSKNTTMIQWANKTKEKLVQEDPAWTNELKDAVKHAAAFKSDLGKVVKTEFVTPFDSLIGNRQLGWVDWLDGIIKDREEKEDDKALFGQFLAEHPGLEHFAGVLRGGTFVLVYDSERSVVADFMLPYPCAEVVEPKPVKPVLPKPIFLDYGILDKAIHIAPSRENFVKDRITAFKQDIEPQWKKEIELQSQGITASVNLMRDVFVNKGTKPGGEGTPVPFTDPQLDLRMRETDIKREKVDMMRERAFDPTLAAEARTAAEEELKNAELELAKSIEGTARYVSTSGMDVKTGTEGFQAMTKISESMVKLTDASALTAVKTGLQTVSTAPTAKPEMQNLVETLIKRRGI